MKIKIKGFENELKLNVDDISIFLINLSQGILKI